MTPVYEVRTKHTKKVLEDFITFTFKMKNPTMTAMIAIFGICFYTLAYIGRDRLFLVIPCIILGTVIVVFAFTRKKIAFSKLSKNDPNYQNQSEICFVFGEREMTIENGTGDGIQHVKYGEIPFIYGDNNYFYISINNEMVHLIPKTDFTIGTPEGFYDFISNKTKQDVRPVHIPWKVRIRLMLEYRDARAEAVKREQEEKQRQKKNKKKNK